MKRIWLLLGLGLGFIFGSKMGRDPYERLESTVRKVSNRPNVKRAMDTASNRAEEVADTVLQVASDKVEETSVKVQNKVNTLAQ
jgi:hypothetical protein